MKKFIFSILLLPLIGGLCYPQGRGDHHKIREKIEQLEKIKLIETLKMDEPTTLKFFARRSEFRDKMKALMDKEDDLLDKLDNAVNSSKEKDNSFYLNMIDQYFDLDQKTFDAKKSFITSLSDILTREQIAKLLVFQKKFREEVRDILFKGGNPPDPHDH